MKKSFRHCKMAAAHRCFSKWVFLKVSQHWSLFSIKLQAFFYRTPAVAASGFSRQQIPFSAKSGMYWRQSHRFLSRTPLKTRVKLQRQPLQLFYKKRQKFCKFHMETPVLKSPFNRVASQETQIKMFSRGAYKIFKN